MCNSIGEKPFGIIIPFATNHIYAFTMFAYLKTQNQMCFLNHL